MFGIWTFIQLIQDYVSNHWRMEIVLSNLERRQNILLHCSMNMYVFTLCSLWKESVEYISARLLCQEENFKNVTMTIYANI